MRYKLYSSYYINNDRNNGIDPFIEIHISCNFIIFNDICLSQKKNIYYNIRYSKTKIYHLVKKQKRVFFFFRISILAKKLQILLCTSHDVKIL